MKTILLSVSILFFTGCAVSLQGAPTASTRPLMCDYIRDAVKGGHMPVELARSRYPECYASDGR